VPGIVGLITQLPSQQARATLRQMLAVLRHEAFYVAGTWEDESQGIYVGWVAKKDSFAEHMPLCNEQRDLVLVFAGEDFPDSDTVSRLKRNGHDVESRGPSYLVHLAEDDPGFVAKLNGRFHGLLIDRSRGSALLFNDRYGLQRLYYHEAKDGFYFAAEAKAILAVKPELRNIDAAAMGEWISCGCVVNNHTLFQDIHVLPPGSAWSFSSRRVERRESYFQPREWEELPVLDEESFYRELRDVFARILPRYFVAEESIGMSMTGGLDTRMVMAWHKAAPNSLPCYTFAGPYRDCHDARIGRQVAESAGQPHQTIRLADAFLSNVPSYLERAVYLSEGCTSVINARNVYVNQRAREIAPIRMTGNYGGEVLRRIRMFKPIDPAPGLFQPELMAHVRQTRQAYSELLKCHPLTFTAFRQTPWYHYGLLSLEETQITTRTPFLDNELVRTAYRAPQSACKEDVCLRLIAEGNPQLAKIPTDRGRRFGRKGIVAELQHQLHEFTFKAEYAYDYGMPQWMARIDHLLSPLHLEKLFLGRHKYAHYRVWYRDVIADYLREVLLDSRSLSRPYLCRTTVEDMVNRHIRGDRNYTSEIHSLLTLELLQHQLIDTAPESADVPASVEAARH
jgi:asparagine synthase (glutamine-hydrolysing)